MQAVIFKKNVDHFFLTAHYSYYLVFVLCRTAFSFVTLCSIQ